MTGLDMETRVLQHKNARLAVRLEQVYWQQLSEFAQAGKQTLSAHVHGLLADVADDQNRASFLRSHCLTKTRGQLQQQEMIPGQTNLGEIITACPSPVFVMSPERKILLYNPAFVSTVLDEMKNRAGGRPVSPRLTFSQPFKKIVQYLVANPNKVVSVQVGFTSEDISLQRNARFALLNRGLGEGSSVVVFVEDNRW